MFESVFRAAQEAADLADLEHDEVPAGEHVVELVRVDLEQVRGHSTKNLLGRNNAVRRAMVLWIQSRRR